MLQSGSTKKSFSSTQSQDIEMVLAREQEMKAEIKALAQQNAQMMAMLTKISAKLWPDDLLRPNSMPPHFGNISG